MCYLLFCCTNHIGIFYCEFTQCGIECHSQTTLPRPHEDALGSSYVDFDLGSLELVVVPLELDLLLGLLAVVGAVVEVPAAASLLSPSPQSAELPLLFYELLPDELLLALWPLLPFSTAFKGTINGHDKCLKTATNSSEN